MKTKLFALSLLIFANVTFVVAQRPQQAEDELAKYIRENYTKREIMVPVRDGIKLFTAIYEPKEK